MGEYAYTLKSEDYYKNFKQSIKSKDTFDSYNKTLRFFMRFKHIAEGQYSELVEGKDTRQIESDIIDFIISLKEKHYTLASQKVYLGALSHFYGINDIILNRKKISKFLSNDDSNINTSTTDNEGEGEGYSGDKPYTHEQIARLLDYSDLRTKVMILIMSSAGLRIGALGILKISDLTPIETHKIYQIRVYANSKSNRHYTFCTPECRRAIDNYLDYRRQCGIEFYRRMKNDELAIQTGKEFEQIVQTQDQDQDQD